MFNFGVVVVGKDGYIVVMDYGNECVWFFSVEGLYFC